MHLLSFGPQLISLVMEGCYEKSYGFKNQIKKEIVISEMEEKNSLKITKSWFKHAAVHEDEYHVFGEGTSTKSTCRKTNSWS